MKILSGKQKLREFIANTPMLKKAKEISSGRKNTIRQKLGSKQRNEEHRK